MMRHIGLLAAVFAFCGAALLLPGRPASGKSDRANVMVEFIDDLAAKKQAAFVSECEIFRDTKAVIVYAVGDDQGHYAILQRSRKIGAKPLALALGATKIDDGDWHIEGTTGGLVSGPAQADMITNLMARPFRFVKSDDLTSVYTDFSARPCDHGGSPPTP